jgi:hypothetical protein
MITQTSIANSTKFASIVALFTLTPAQPKTYTYADEVQLADEMAQMLPENPQPLPEVAPEDFEKLYGWFLS